MWALVGKGGEPNFPENCMEMKKIGRKFYYVDPTLLFIKTNRNIKTIRLPSVTGRCMIFTETGFVTVLPQPTSHKSQRKLPSNGIMLAFYEPSPRSDVCK